ncbi:hypothetical protein PM082_005700 [Marasmius tenuissimus]|nr:hypothetical protein PM082_005700 [Marasmius tenuissimus]
MNGDSGTTSSEFSTMRATKRKLDDAFYRLDAAVTPKEPTDEQPPRKKLLLSQSIYSTLTKYGIKSKEADSSKGPLRNFTSLSKSAPHLSAILTRAATRTRERLSKSSSPGPSVSTTADYRPSSIPSFLNRLSTFKLSTYGNKPPQIDAVAASKCGWTNDGKDRLVCGICGVSWVVAGREGMSREAANALIEKQRQQLVDAHKSGCPWKTRQCNGVCHFSIVQSTMLTFRYKDLIYRIPLQSPAATVRELKTNASILDPILQSVEIKHPLTPSQLASLQAAITSAEPAPSPEENSDQPTNGTPPPSPSMTAVLTTLFGWAPAPERPRTTSLSRSTSRLPTASSTPSLSRASSLAPSSTPSILRDAASKAKARDTSLLHCALCQRRIGMWAFVSQTAPTTPTPADDSTPAPQASKPSAPKQRQFDLLKEHRSYCPYVVRSTVVPTLPSTSISTVSLPQSRSGNGHVRSSSSTSQLSASGNNGPIEGWRAVLTVALRYRMVQRRKSSRRLAQGIEEGGSGHGDDMDTEDGVNAMLEGVKTRGGKDLLKYVKGLLG